MHERCNGSGYPRRRKTGQIHQLSKIAAVADVFAALVSPRPHRLGMLPYYAVEHLLRGAHSGLFDPQFVRLLLRTISLFPVGSCVELSDGRRGRVLRSNGASYAQPIVETWDRGHQNGPSQVVDLAAEPDLRIQRPLADLSREADSVLGDDWDSGVP